MRVLVEHDSVAGFRVRTDTDLISHRPGDHIYGVFLAEQISYFTLKLFDSWIVAIYIVSDDRRSDRPAHFLCGLAACIATQINHIVLRGGHRLR
ncbi:hypothetical protein BCAR13_440100 [Paraburkholderia caribensis]|nr:hypothetical protein BCAR13_440100 [Paraburkholderia caribensis]